MIEFALLLNRRFYYNCSLARLVPSIIGRVFAIKMDSVCSRLPDRSPSNGSRQVELSQQKRLLRNHALRLQNSSNESSLQQVPASIRNFFLPYLRHIHSIDSAAYCLDNLFVMNESRFANSRLPRKFKNIMDKLKNDFNGLTDELIDHLCTNNSTGSIEKKTENVTEVRTVDYVPFDIENEEYWPSETANLVCSNSSSGSKRKQVNDELTTKKTKTETDLYVDSSKSGDALGSNLRFNERGQLLVFIDGACFSNGRAIAKAGLGVWFNYNHPLNISEPVKGTPSNNNAEIQAATRAILQANSIGIKKIKLHTDSQFLINCMTQWIHKWKKNNWMTVSKQPVKNKESLSELDGVMPLMEEVEWEYVEGHAGIAGNEEADVLAKKGATLYKSFKRPSSED